MVDNDPIVRTRDEKEITGDSSRCYRYECLKQANDPILLADHCLRIIAANDRAVDTYGYSLARLLTINLLDLAGPGAGSAIERRLQELETREGVIFEAVHKRVDESIFPVEISMRLIELNGKRLYHNIIRDISARKRTEKELERLRWQNELILNSAAEGVLGLDLKGRHTFVNPAAARMLGYSTESLIGQPSHVLWHYSRPDGSCFPEEECPIYAAYKDGEVHHVTDDLFWRKDGASFHVEYSSTPIWEDNRLAGAVVTFKDVTERKELEAERLKASRLESIGILAGGIAHDLNNLLTVVMGNIDLIKFYSKPGEKVHDRAIEIEKAAVHARDLARQFLTFSKGGLPVKKIVNLKSLIRAAAGLACHGSNVQCRFTISEDLRPAEVDEAQMTQVINNVVLNAVQAMPEGGFVDVTAENSEVERSPLPLRPGKYVKISVRDHGIGIPQKHLPKIFDPYFTTKANGNGFGLTISYSIVKNHGGHISVQSEVSVGTTVHIYLPALPEETASV